MIIEVKDGRSGFRLVETIDRLPRQHAGWASVRYRGQRFQLFGGIRVNYFIDLSHTLKGRQG